MPRVRRFVPILTALLLIPADARGQGPSDPDARNEVRRQLIELQRARRAALIAQDKLELARRIGLANEPIPAGQDDPFDAEGPGARPMPHLPSRLEAIDAEVRAAWARVFEVQVFGRVAGEADVKEHLARLIESHLVDTVKAHGLSPNEVEKLRLAANGDVKRYLGRCAEVRHRFEEAAGGSTLRPGSAGELALLQSGFRRGPFGEGSLFAKVLAKIVATREAAGGERP